MDVDNDTLLHIKDLQISFPLQEGLIKAVEGVSLTLRRGKVLGVVGESGCGKTVTALATMRLIGRPGRIDGGQILFNRKLAGHNGNTQHQVVDLARLKPSGKEMRAIRGADVAMIFQEPMSSFSPLYTIGNQISEVITLHQNVSRAEARERAIEMLRRVGIASPEKRIDEYPHQFSGGMRQRAMIAMALSCRPALLIADEPTTALDVTIQAQILALMRDLQEEFGMAIMFITHNLGVIAQIADEIAIMYLGRVVEQGTVDDIFNNPKHPYTLGLLKAIPRLGRAAGRPLVAVEGNIPSPFRRPPGCAFHPRCPQSIAGRCDVHNPQVTKVGSRHEVSCVLYE